MIHCTFDHVLLPNITACSIVVIYYHYSVWLMVRRVDMQAYACTLKRPHYFSKKNIYENIIAYLSNQIYSSFVNDLHTHLPIQVSPAFLELNAYLIWFHLNNLVTSKVFTINENIFSSNIN